MSATVLAPTSGPWSTLDTKAVATCRGLVLDAVETARGGHAGSAMDLTPVMYVLYQRILRHDPSAPDWIGRDRMVLSVGHASLALYAQLYLSGYGLELNDIRSYRDFGGITPSHPERQLTSGVEITTGSLGQGISTAVGMAMEARRLQQMLDPNHHTEGSVFDYSVYVVTSDGEMQEGITSEASSLAGHLGLGNLVVIYDANRISLDGPTDLSFSENVLQRYDAYGWHTQLVSDGNDLQAIERALVSARERREQPSIIQVESTIGWPAPTLAGTGSAHGGPYGHAEVAATKKALGLDPSKSFVVLEDVLTHTRRTVADHARANRQAWSEAFELWAEKNPAQHEELIRLGSHRMPSDWDAGMPSFVPGTSIDPRTASGQVIKAIAARVPEFWGGAADLTEPCATALDLEATSSSQTGETGLGRYVHFGVREHAMGAIVTGMAASGLTRPFAATMLAFSNYMFGAVRMTALMKLPAIFLWTHDSIGVGKDGPTHQPIEQIASLRALPGLDVIRPSDADETVAAWRAIMQRRQGPAALLLPNVLTEVLERSPQGPYQTADNLERGAYTLIDASDGAPDVILIGTGSEVRTAIAARALLERDGISTRVVSMPCIEWFRAQDQMYRDTVLPPSVRARVSVEAAAGLGWKEWVGDFGRIISVDDFSEAGDGEVLFAKAGISADTVIHEAKRSLNDSRMRG